MSDLSIDTAIPQVNITVQPTGLNGRDGIDGAPGRDGVDGAPGRDGVDGVNGVDGEDGAPGRDGVDGAPGQSGVNGQDGIGISSVEIDDRNHLILTLSDESVQDAGLLNTVDQETLDTISRLDGIRTIRANVPDNRGSDYYDGAVLTFIDDDGTIRFLTEHVPVYRSHGVTATTAVVACRAITPVGTTTSGDPYEAMSFEQLREIAREGFDIQSHTWSHARSAFNSGYNQNATDTDIDLEYRLADEAFRQNGFDYNCMVFPWGAHEARHLSLARRYARFGVNCRGMNGQNDGLGDPMDLNRLGASANGGNLDQLKAAIDTAIQQKNWLIIMTHAGSAQPDAASLDALLTYAQAQGIRIENFREAARLKAPAYYAGNGNTAFRVMPDGKTYFTLSDASIKTMIARAYELGYISSAANAIDSLTAVWTGTTPLAGTSIDPIHITVTAHLHDGSTRVITDFTVDGSLTMSEGENTLTIRYGTLSAALVLTAAASENGATTFLGEHTTVYNGASERDRVWFARHMEAGTYALHIALSEPMGTSTSTSTSALKLKTANVFGDINGTELFDLPTQTMQNRTSFDGAITLDEATDGFFLYAKLLKKGVQIQIYVSGEVTDSTLLDIEPVATLQASAASPGNGWFPMNLAVGAHAYKLEVGGSVGNTSAVLTIKAASAEGDTNGAQLLSFTGNQCSGGMTVMDTLTLAEAVSYLYISYLPDTRSTFTTTLIVV